MASRGRPMTEDDLVWHDEPDTPGFLGQQAPPASFSAQGAEGHGTQATSSQILGVIPEENEDDSVSTSTIDNDPSNNANNIANELGIPPLPPPAPHYDLQLDELEGEFERHLRRELEVARRYQKESLANSEAWYPLVKWTSSTHKTPPTVEECEVIADRVLQIEQFDPANFKPRCQLCNETEETLGHKVAYMCPRCVETNHYIRYCGRICFETDWRRHKTVCGIILQPPLPGNTRPQLRQFMPARICQDHFTLAYNFVDAAQDIFTQTFFLNGFQALKLVVESYRLLDEVKRDYNPHLMHPQRFYQYLEGYSFEGFKRYLDRTLADRALNRWMPMEWDENARKQCEAIGAYMYHWDDFENSCQREINDYDRYGGPKVRIALRTAAARIAGEVTQEVADRLTYMFAMDAMMLIEWDNPNSKFHWG